MKIAVVAVTKNAKKLALKIKKALPRSKVYLSKKVGEAKGTALFNGSLRSLTKKLFTEFEGIVFCMAMGIVVRSIAPYLKDKYTDPAVVAIDGQGRFAISVLSGHEGGANKLAIDLGNILGAEPIITTASESKKNIAIGIGCRRGIKKENVVKAIKHGITKAKCSIDKVRCISTIDIKRNELGLKEACMELGIPLRVISSDAIKKFNGRYQRSSFVKKKIGVEGVSEPCALLAASAAKLVVPKEILSGITVAVAKEG